MQSPHVLVLERDPIIGNDMREEVLALSKDAVVRLAATAVAARDLAAAMPRIDLLIFSSRSNGLVDPALAQRLTGRAGTVMFIGEPEETSPFAPRNGTHLARTPFTSASLREDLSGITVDGAPLFPRRSPERRR